jgi:hypothetical protein
MDTQLSYLIDGWVTTRPTISDLCHSALVSCDTISSERIAPPRRAEWLRHRVSSAIFQCWCRAKNSSGEKRHPLTPTLGVFKPTNFVCLNILLLGTLFDWSFDHGA